MTAHASQKLTSDDFYSRSELLKMLNITPQTLRRWIESGELPSPIRLVRAKTLLFRRKDIDDWFRKKGPRHTGRTRSRSTQPEAAYTDHPGQISKTSKETTT